MDIHMIMYIEIIVIFIRCKKLLETALGALVRGLEFEGLKFVPMN